MNKPSTLRLITIVAPLLCLILAAVLTASQARRLQAQETQRTLITQQITSLDQLAREIQARPPVSKMAAAPPSPDEQPVFLELIRGFATASRVQLVKYENKTVPPPAQGSADAKANALPENVVALTSNVEVAGSYNQVRQFMNELWTSPRLFNTTELKWTATDKWPITRLSFVLTRYVHLVDTSVPGSNAPRTNAAPQEGGSDTEGNRRPSGATSALPGPGSAASAATTVLPATNAAARGASAMPRSTMPASRPMPAASGAYRPAAGAAAHP